MLERTEVEELESEQTVEPAARTTTAPVKRKNRTALLVTVGVAALLGVGIYLGIRSRTEAETALAADTIEASVSTVNVIHPQPSAPDESLVLPGQTMAFTDAPIYARTNGYLKQWFFDI